MKHMALNRDLNVILLDLAGHYSPVSLTSKLSVVEKEATEKFLQDILFFFSDIFIFVLEEFTLIE